MAALRNEYSPHYTYDDYKSWEGEWELIGGTPYAMAPAPKIKHQAISQRIAWQLQERLQYCSECRALLPVDWKIDEDTVVQPDNLVICYDPKDAAYLTKAPVLIFEVLSKTTALKDTKLKFELYEREGVRYYVMVDPEDRIAHCYRLNGEGRYVKLADATQESVRFALHDSCEIDFDFSKIWA
jgi:Uma2 family endonuclease